MRIITNRGDFHMNTITNRRLQVLRLIDEGVKANLTSPSCSALARALDLSSTSTVHGHISVLIDHGLVENIDPGIGRRGALRVTEKGAAFLASKVDEKAGYTDPVEGK